MSNIAMKKTPGYFSYEFLAFASATFTANSPATGTDGVYVTGAEIDRFSIQSQFFGAKAIMPVTVAGLTATDTVSIIFKLEDSAVEGGPYANGVESTAVVVSADGSYVVTGDFDISSMRRWIRLSVKCTFDATATDTVVGAAVLSAGGLDEYPVEVTPPAAAS